jgi:ATP-binding cassette subfamily C protein
LIGVSVLPISSVWVGRISSAKRAQTVLVLDGSRAHVGSHRELLVASPMYRDLVGHWDRGDLSRPIADPTPAPKPPCFSL